MHEINQMEYRYFKHTANYTHSAGDYASNKCESTMIPNENYAIVLANTNCGLINLFRNVMQQ